MMTPGRRDHGVGHGRLGPAHVFGDLYAWAGAIALWKHEFTEAVDEYGQPEGLSGRTSLNSAGWVSAGGDTAAILTPSASADHARYTGTSWNRPEVSWAGVSFARTSLPTSWDFS